MPPLLPSLTATWHNNTYPSISPSRPELSAAGKSIVITGGGQGIGRGIVSAFASAGAKSIAILGRTQRTLTETKDAVGPQYPKTSITTHVVDISEPAAVKTAAEAIGTWDVLVLNAGFLSEPNTIRDTDVDDWWKAFETNVKGTMVTCRAFLATKPTHNTTIIGISAGLLCMPTAFAVRSSSYVSSKSAAVKLLEIVAAENPDVHVVTLHPGVVETAMLYKSGLTANGKVPLDDVLLPAHFTVWLASPEAAFLRGKFVWTNWDVDELKAKEAEIRGSDMLTLNLVGWPFSDRGQTNGVEPPGDRGHVNGVGAPSDRGHVNESEAPTDRDHVNGVEMLIKGGHINEVNGVEAPSDHDHVNGSDAPSDRDHVNGVEIPSDGSHVNGVEMLIKGGHISGVNGVEMPSDSSHVNGVEAPSDHDHINGVEMPIKGGHINGVNGVEAPNERDHINEVKMPSKHGHINGDAVPSKVENE